MHEAGRITGKLDRIQITSWLPTTLELIKVPMNYSRGAIFSAASFDVITGCTSKSTRSLQFAIHSSSIARSWVSIS